MTIKASESQIGERLGEIINFTFVIDYQIEKRALVTQQRHFDQKRWLKIVLNRNFYIMYIICWRAKLIFTHKCN